MSQNNWTHGLPFRPLVTLSLSQKRLLKNAGANFQTKPIERWGNVPWEPPHRPAITSFQASHRGGRSHCDACDLGLSKSPEAPTETWKLYGHRCGYVVKECKKNHGGMFKAFKIFEKVAFWRIGTWFGLVAWWACFVIVIVSLGYYVREETIWNDKSIHWYGFVIRSAQ